MSQDVERSLFKSYRQLQTLAAHNGHRFLLLWAGERAWSVQNMQRALADTEGETVALGVGDDRRGASVRDVLGQEFAAVGIDAWTHSHVNDILALAGTLRAGGLLHIACPPLAEWPQQFVAAQQKRGLQAKQALFLQRFLRIAKTSPAVFLMAQNNPFLSPLPLSKVEQWQQELPSAAQNQVIDEIKRVVTGRAKRPLVLTADRGRGKTTALGLAAAQLLKEGKAKRILLVATSYASVATAFQHCAQQLTLTEKREQGLLAAQGELQFVPPDMALKVHAPEWDLVLIDEAAKLPVSLLLKLTEKFQRAVFSTTVQGYEGSGQGFVIRFGETLQRVRPQARRASLDAPIRWAKDDPLEYFLNRVFVLDQQRQNLPVADPEQVLTYCELSQEDLLSNEALLTQVFGLLVQAHYQTSPADLQFLLDSPVKLMAAFQGKNIVGVCEYLPEGLSDPPLAAAVVQAQRRPPGNLVAQRLAQYFGDSYYLSETSWRIHRIAVAQECRRKAIGSGLVASVVAAAKKCGVSYLSSSFALESDVLRFWRQVDFTPVYLGSRRDSSSGSYSLIVLQGLSAISRERASQAARQLAGDLPTSLPISHPELDGQNALALLTSLASSLPPNPSLANDRQRVMRYVHNELVFEQCVASLQRLICSARFINLLTAQALPLVECIVLGHSRSDVAVQYGFAGKSDLEQRFKIILADMVVNKIEER